MFVLDVASQVQMVPCEVTSGELVQNCLNR